VRMGEAKQGRLDACGHLALHILATAMNAMFFIVSMRS
jgi:hypothetical protein